MNKFQSRPASGARSRDTMAEAVESPRLLLAALHFFGAGAMRFVIFKLAARNHHTDYNISINELS